jgi:hypothetical protein
MNRPAALLLTALVVASSLSVSGFAVAQSAQVSITGVAVSDDQPAPGQLITFTTTVRNGAGTASNPSGPYEITAVALRSGPGQFEEYARVREVGTVPAGGEIEVPLTVKFRESGVRNLRLIVYGRSGGEPLQLRYPVAIRVRDSGPRLSIDVDDAVAGDETPVRVTVSNGESDTANNLRVTLSGEGMRVANDTRVAPRLDSGAERTFRFEATPDSGGEGTLNATLSYLTDEGSRRVVTETRLVAVEQLREDVSVSAEVRGDGTRPPVAVDVSNFGNAPLSDLTVRLERDGQVVGRTSAPDLPARTSDTVLVNVTGDGASDLRVVAEYETGGRAGEATTRLAYAANPGRVELTGVDVETEGDRLHLTGSASNVGLGEVNSVVLSVVPSDGVRPARPYREYFVGTVPASDFVSFDLYADVDTDTESIPVRISYIADGSRVSEVATVDVSDVNAQPAGQSQQRQRTGFSLPLVIGGGAVVVAGLGVVGYLFYRTRR